MELKKLASLNNLHRTAYPLLLLILVAVLSACRIPAASSHGGLTPSPTPQVEVTWLPNTASPIRSRPSSTAVPEPSPTVTLLPGPTSSPTPVLQVCTPLLEHPLAELRLITSDPYRPPPPHHEERHHGVDFSYYRRGERTSIRGVTVQSILPGRVAASIPDSFPYGNVVIIETPASLLSSELRQIITPSEGESLYVLYAHMEEAPLVTLNEQVGACQPIGAVGSSGNTVEPHLHLETRLGPAATTFTVMGFYQANTTDLEQENYTMWRTSGIYHHFDPMSLLDPQAASGTATPAPTQYK